MIWLKNYLFGVKQQSLIEILYRSRRTYTRDLYACYMCLTQLLATFQLYYDCWWAEPVYQEKTTYRLQCTNIFFIKMFRVHFVISGKSKFKQRNNTELFNSSVDANPNTMQSQQQRPLIFYTLKMDKYNEIIICLLINGSFD
jgi:hypothetical protein